MSQTSEPTIIDSEPMTVAALREQVPMSELAGFYDRAYGTVAGVIAGQGAQIAGPALGIYFGQPTSTADVAAGFPIASGFEPTDGVEIIDLPARRIAQTLYTGGYDGLAGAYEQLVGFIVSAGLAPGELMWEQYLTEPTPDGDPAENQTLIAWVVDAS